MAASLASRELLWLRELLTEMNLQVCDPVIVWEDNQGCIKLVESEKFGARTKHIAVCHFLLRDLQEKGVLRLQYCPSEEMLADIFTKPLPKVLFCKFVDGLGLSS